MNTKFKSNIQLESLSEKLRKVEETNAANELHTFITHVWENWKKLNSSSELNIMVVGDGDNYPAALFSKFSILEKYYTTHVQTFTTQYALSYLTQCDNYSKPCNFKPTFDLIIGIDFDGHSKEMNEIAKLCHYTDTYFLLITAASEIVFDKNIYFTDSVKACIISCDYFEVLSDKKPHALSFISTLAPVALFDDDYYQNYYHLNEQELNKGKKFVNNLDISCIVSSLSKSPITHVFYERTTEPTAYDIKHKFMASGVANVILHEKNNFSNGDINILLNNDIGLIINLVKYNGNSKYNRNLDCFLSDFCNKNNYNYIAIGSNCSDNSQWNIEAMMMLPYLITAIGNTLNIDVCNPKNQIKKEETQKTFY